MNLIEDHKILTCAALIAVVLITIAMAAVATESFLSGRIGPGDTFITLALSALAFGIAATFAFDLLMDYLNLR